MSSNIITIHSFKGGTGKSLIASTLAYHCAAIRKEKVILVDVDFPAPSLSTFFKNEHVEKTIVDFLMEGISVKKIVINTSIPNLDIIYGPTPEVGKNIITMDAKWHAKALQNILKLLSYLKTKMDYKWIIFDNQSGITLNSINFLTISTSSITVLRPSRYAVHSTLQLSEVIFKRLSLTVDEGIRKDFLVWNQVPYGVKEEEMKQLLAKWNITFEEVGLKKIATIPYNNALASVLFIEPEYNVAEIYKFLDKEISQITNAVLDEEPSKS